MGEDKEYEYEEILQMWNGVGEQRERFRKLGF